MPIMDGATIGTIRTTAGVTGDRGSASTSTSDANQLPVLRFRLNAMARLIEANGNE